MEPTLSTLEPLQYYESHGQGKHHQNALEYFDELLKRSGVDAQQNKETVEQYRTQLEISQNVEKKLNKYKTFRGLTVILLIAGIICAIAGVASESSTLIKILLILVGAAAFIGSILLLVKKINPVIKNVDALLGEEKAKAEKLLQQATEQMAPLNALFDDDDIKKIIEKTLPEIKFDRNYTAQRHLEFLEKYDYAEEENDEISVVNTLSGTMNQNPFVYERRLVHEMGTETYEGSLTIYWTETYTDSDGNVVRTRRSQVLTATVEKPKPYYSYRTALRYGHQGAPDLSFSRCFGHIERLSDKAVEKRVKAGEKELQKKARAAMKEGRSFTEMANSQFDVLFGADDRDQEVQFRMMFTPLAQTGMVKLMRSKTGFGDDFNFVKEKRCNWICSEHAQEWDMDTSPEKFHSYDLDEARNSFVRFNDEYFKSVFFDFAPLLTIPLYQQKPTQVLEVPLDDYPNYTLPEYETLANAIDRELIQHSKTETEVIIKAAFAGKAGNVDKISLTAYSYRTEERVDYISVLGGDGNFHNVPVPWLEYIPLTKTSTMAIKAAPYSQHAFIREASNRYAEQLSSIIERCAQGHELFAYLLEPKENFDVALTKLNFLN